MATDRIRMSGLVSGLDTETIVGALVSAASYKTTKLKNTQTKLGWKQESWKSLNSEIYSLYTGKLDNLRYEGNYNAKKATLDSDIATISADNNAILGSQTLEVRQMAKSGYLTGGKVSDESGKAVKADALVGDVARMTEDATIKINGKKIKITGGMNMDQVAEAFAKAGVTANYDSTNGRFFISSKSSGKDANFEIEYNDEDTNDSGRRVLDALGLGYTYEEVDGVRSYASTGGSDLVKIQGQNAKIVLNGAEFESSGNSFSINGLNITAKGVSERDATSPTGYKSSVITTSIDVDKIYDSIKDFFKSYNELIKKMDTYYNADAAKGYDVLSEQEKEAMSDEEVEVWEKKIKDSLLRRDDNLNSIINLFKDNFAKSVTVNGKSYSLASFGVATLGYFEAGDNEHGMYHIDGDPDDENTKSKDDSLKKMIASDPETVSKFFSQLFKGVYTELNQAMRSVPDTRSAMKMYDDKLLKKEYDRLTNDIAAQEAKVQEMEDHYYDKFTAMEKALSKLNTESSSFASMLG